MVEIEIPDLDNAEGIRLKGRDLLVSNLGSLVNNSESSDVAFRCNDGRAVYASRWLLANRCAVFKGMLCNGMVETRLSEIPLNFASPVMLSILEYLYTGAIDSYPPVNWKMGFELISAAQYFMISIVESIAMDFLRSQASDNGNILKQHVAMDMLSVAVEFQENWEGKDSMLLKLIDQVGDDWFKEDCSYRLSRDAVEYILCNSRFELDQGENQPSVEEYLTFRKIVLWHVYQVVPSGDTKAKTALDKVLPGRSSPSLWHKMVKIPDIDGYLSDVPISAGSWDSTVVLNSLVGTNICKDSLEHLLRHVNLFRIPASLLLNVIEPLKVIPPQQFLNGLVHVTRDRRVQYSLSASDWRHSSSLSIGVDGKVFCHGRERSSSGVAVAFISQPSSSGIREWNFEVLEDDEIECIDFGLIVLPTGTSLEDVNEGLHYDLHGTSSAVVLCSERIDSGITTARWNELEWDYSSGSDWDFFYVEVDVVTFRLNELEKTCEVKFGNSFGVESFVWDLLDGRYYPAIGFQNCKSGVAQLRLVSGFDRH